MNTKGLQFHCLAAACALLAANASAAAQGDEALPSADTEAPNRPPVEQELRLQHLRRILDAGEAQLRDLRRALDEEQLGTLRAGQGAAAASGGQPQARENRPAAAQAAAPTSPATAEPSTPGGEQAAPLPKIFEEPSVLTPRGKFVLEPSLQYSYSSNHRVALIGYSVIPAIVIGLIDVREVKRNTVTAALAGRYGLTRRLEVETRVPYVYRSDSTLSRSISEPSSADEVFQTSGKDWGDVEVAARYQLNSGGVDRPFFVAGLRVKSRTGTDPFEVTTDCTTACTGTDVRGTGLPLTLPTGSGFVSIQPNLTWLLPSDPAVLFGSFSYTHHRKRHVRRTVREGELEDLGEIEPGAGLGFNIGVGLSLNERSAISFGYDHNSIGRTKQNGVNAPGSVRIQLGTLALGYSHRFSAQRSLNVSIGVGVTRDTPDLTLSVRMPFSF